MNRFIHLVRVFNRLSLSRKVMIFWMIMILGYTSFLVRFIPLRFYYNRYIADNDDMNIKTMQPFGDQIVLYKKVMLLIPWKVTCLIESLAFFIYFKRYGIQVPIYVGVKTGERMEAHAWNFSANSQGFSAIDK